MLFRLLLIRLRAGVRQRLLELKTMRGLLFLLVTIAVIALLMRQSALPENPLKTLFSGETEALKGQINQFLPISLLSAFLLMVIFAPSPPIYFSPAEIGLLFSGPFTRRALILYKLSIYAFGALLSSLLIALLIPASSYLPMSAFLGAFLSMVFIQLLTVASGLLGQLLENCCGSRIPRGFVVMLMLLLAAVGWQAAVTSASLPQALAQFQSSTAGSVILAPFGLFARIFLAQSIFPELLTWATFGVIVVLGLLVAVIQLDGYSSETSTDASLRLYGRWDRARRSGLPWGVQTLAVHASRHSPRFFGIGPLAWRQLLSAFRTSGKVLWVYLALALLAGPLLVMASADISKWSLVGGAFFAAVFMVPRTLVFDFRTDLEAMENFKALPLAPWKISIGQLAAPVLLTGLIELVLLGSTAAFMPDHSRILLVYISLFLIPFNMLLYGLENLFFLLFPAPLVPIGRMDFDFLGRTIVGFVFTSTVLIGACLLALSAGQAAIGSTGWAGSAFVAVAWLSFTLAALMTVPLLSWAFKRFDVSRR